MRPEMLICRVFDVDAPSLNDESSNRTVQNWDSMGHVGLIAALESEYGIEISADEALRMTSVGAIKDALRSRGIEW